MTDINELQKAIDTVKEIYNKIDKDNIEAPDKIFAIKIVIQLACSHLEYLKSKYEA